MKIRFKLPVFQPGDFWKRKSIILDRAGVKNIKLYALAYCKSNDKNDNRLIYDWACGLIRNKKEFNVVLEIK